MGQVNPTTATDVAEKLDTEGIEETTEEESEEDSEEDSETC